MRKFPEPSVIAEPRSSSWSQSLSKARTLTPPTGSCESQTVTRPQMTHVPNRLRIWHQKRLGILYSHAAIRAPSALSPLLNPCCICRHIGWMVVMENCRGRGGCGPTFKCGTVPQYTSTSKTSPLYCCCSPNSKTNFPSPSVSLSAIKDDAFASTISSVKMTNVSLGFAAASAGTFCSSRFRYKRTVTLASGSIYSEQSKPDNEPLNV